MIELVRRDLGVKEDRLDGLPPPAPAPAPAPASPSDSESDQSDVAYESCSRNSASSWLSFLLHISSHPLQSQSPIARRLLTARPAPSCPRARALDSRPQLDPLCAPARNNIHHALSDLVIRACSHSIRTELSVAIAIAIAITIGFAVPVRRPTLPRLPAPRLAPRRPRTTHALASRVRQRARARARALSDAIGPGPSAHRGPDGSDGCLCEQDLFPNDDRRLDRG